MAKVKEAKLWKWFSLFTRLRDSDEKGYCRCYTCGAIRFFRQAHAGHGLGRQHKAVKYNEKNVRAQCAPCNLDGGRQDVFKKKMNEEHGAGTWEFLELFSRKVTKWSQFEVDQMAKFYEQEARKLAVSKGLKL